MTDDKDKIIDDINKRNSVLLNQLNDITIEKEKEISELIIKNEELEI
jgi:hypothetical protein